MHLTDHEQAALLKKLPILRFFEYEHLPGNLQAESAPFCDLAWEAAAGGARWIDGEPQTNAELGAGLRKLLEAKDCFVRARL